MVWGRLRLSRSGREFEAMLLVDTGSTATIVSELDIERLGLSVDSLPKARRGGLGLGGYVAESRLKGLVIGLHAPGGPPLDFPLPEVRVHRAPSRPRGLRLALRRVPTILGQDFLERFGLRLTIDYGTREVSLEMGGR